MANNPPSSSIGLILVVNSVIEKAMVAITLLNDLMARAYVISPNPSAHYTERHYNRVPDTRRQGQGSKPPAQQKGPCFVCWKRGCWSSNHPDKEHKAAYEKRLGKKKAQQYITIVDDDELWAKIGVSDPSVFVACMDKEASDEEPLSDEKDPISPLEWDLSTPSEPSLDCFFLRSSLAPEEELVNNLSNMKMYHAMMK